MSLVPQKSGVAITEMHSSVIQNGRIWHVIFILDQNHAFLKSLIFFICHVVLVLNFLPFLVGKGDFWPGICCFECGLFTHLCKALEKLPLSVVFEAESRF